jgi:aromatic-L-amino-acid decarboxylase
MDVFQAGLTPFLVVGSIGTIVEGVVDPLEDIAVVAKQYKMWFHVDGAYGGLMLVTDAVKHMAKGELWCKQGQTYVSPEVTRAI